jgi:ribonuclease R
VYAQENLGHFGLALEAYGHFTSPIRRYPDLLLHRAIKHALKGGTAVDFRTASTTWPRSTLQCSARERRADEAEREVDERLPRRVDGAARRRPLRGTISGVTSFGLFIELDDSKVNGLVHVTQLPNDYYHFDPIRKTLTGERGGREFRLGDRADIIVLKASVEDRRIDFRLVEERGVLPPPPRGTPAKKVKKKY